MSRTAVPPADAFSGVIILVILGLGLVMLGVIILLEALILRRLNWATLGRCILDSFVMNIASAFIGLSLAWILPIDLTRARETGMLFPIFFISFALSVFSEAGVISLLRKRPVREIIRSFAVVNLVSYILLIIFFEVGNIV
jgi:hypothetical protein